MFTYIKYISLLIFSGLILTFYRATLPTANLSAQTLRVITSKAGRQHTNFSVLRDVILPVFPALDKGELIPGNKK